MTKEGGNLGHLSIGDLVTIGALLLALVAIVALLEARSDT